MGYLSHRVDRSEIKAGDHIYTYRSAFTYSHHGIYVGGNKVIHFTAPENATSDSALNFSSGFPSLYQNLSASCLNSLGCEFPKLKSEEICNLSSFVDQNIPPSCLSINVCGFHQPGSGVILSCLNCFIGTGSLRLYQYQVKTFVYFSKRGGTCTIAKSDPPQKVIHRAEYLLQHGFGSYDVVRNNCEDFTLYCKTGLLIGGKTKTTTGSNGQVNFINTAIISKPLTQNTKSINKKKMGYLSHRVDRSEIKAGDHIYTYRSAFTYSHHGIYVGGNKVINLTAPENYISDSALNFSSAFPSSYQNLPASCLNSLACEFPQPKSEEICNLSSLVNQNIPPSCLSINVCGFHQPGSGVILSCLNCFIGTGSLHLYQYQVKPFVYVSKLRGGTCTIAKSDPPQEVIHRAEYLLQHGFGSYDVVKNNCEDFALYCKTGLLIGGEAKTTTGSSGQVNFMNTAINGSVSFIVNSTVQRIVWGSIPIGEVAVAVGKNGWNRYKTDIGVRDDVVNVKVEDVADSRGC